jgi:hypothetical protein
VKYTVNRSVDLLDRPKAYFFKFRGAIVCFFAKSQGHLNMDFEKIKRQKFRPMGPYEKSLWGDKWVACWPEIIGGDLYNR